MHNAVSSVMSVLDGNNDKILKKDDLSIYMKSLGELLVLLALLKLVCFLSFMIINFAYI